MMKPSSHFLSWRSIGRRCAFFPTLALALALAVPATTLGQVQFELQLNLPERLPPLVEVRPGVRVVRDLDEEIFFVNGRYWLRRDERWYRTGNPRGRWVRVEQRRVPTELNRMPNGLFRNWHGRPANLPERLPPLVTVRPGVRVVRDLDEEVFYARGYYWVRHDGHWFRARDHRRNWAYVEPGRVPRELVRSPPGRYRRWGGNEADHQARRGPQQGPGEWQHQERGGPQQGPGGPDDRDPDRR